MEGFRVPVEKKRPADEAERIVGRGEKVERAETNVKGMFDSNMETEDVIKRVMEENRSSFSGPEERDF